MFKSGFDIQAALSPACWLKSRLQSSLCSIHTKMIQHIKYNTRNHKNTSLSSHNKQWQLIFVQDCAKKGNYEFSIMLQDWKEQVFSSERSKTVTVSQHLARKCHLRKAEVDDRAESTPQSPFQSTWTTTTSKKEEKPNRKDEQMKVNLRLIVVSLS